MKYEVVPNSCRICLRRTLKLRSMYQPLEEGDEPPHEMFRLITGVALEDADTNAALPKSMCKNCELSLNLAFQFRVKALKSQRIIQIYSNQLCTGDDGNGDTKQSHNSSCAAPPHVKQELEEFIELHEPMEEEYVNEEELCCPKEMKIEMLELSFSDGDEDGFSSVGKAEYLEDAEFEAEVVNTNEENGQELQAKASTYCTYSDENEKEENDYLTNTPEKRKKHSSISSRKSREHNSTPNSTKQPVATTSSNLRRGRRAKYVDEGCPSAKKHGAELAKRLSELADSEIAQTDGEPDKEQKKQGKRTDDSSGHICDICGNIYAKRGRMMEHRRRHDKELKYACELCDKRFHLREKLRKHMYSHKGGKPHKCSFCSRTFFYESVKKAHEKVHNGYKPYVCEQCNKAFAYAHALSKHKLIHADIKLYHCEYCNKDFRLQHHMKQHIETKLHQNAVREATEAGTVAATSSALLNAPLAATIATH